MSPIQDSAERRVTALGKTTHQEGGVDRDRLSIRGFDWRTSLENSFRIMIAHPSPRIRMKLARGFRNSGCQVDLVADGLELIDWLAEIVDKSVPGARPDLIVSDLGLPGRHGSRLLADLRSGGWDTPFVMITDGCKTRALARVLGFGMVVVFEAPYEVHDLVTAAKLLVEQNRRTAENHPRV